MIATQPQPRCPACGLEGQPLHADVQDYYFGAPGNWQLRACRAGCGTAWLDPAPLASDIGKAYANYHTHSGRKQRTWASRLRSLYERVLRLRLRGHEAAKEAALRSKARKTMHLGDLPPGRVLDIGCGGGRFLRRMQRLGWEAEGVDFDAEATRRVSENYNVRTYTGDVRALALPAAHYDAIVMNHAIEHVDDPGAVLRECARLLKPGGRLVLITPNAQSVAHRRYGKYWRGLEVPRHLQVFSRAGLQRCVEDAGLTVSVAQTFSCDAADVYRVSDEMAARQTGRPYDPIASTRRAQLAMLAEQRRLARSPDCGEDVLVVAVRGRSATPD